MQFSETIKLFIVQLRKGGHLVQHNREAEVSVEGLLGEKLHLLHLMEGAGAGSFPVQWSMATL